MTEQRARLLAHARQSIQRGSISFAAASRLFDRQTRERVWLLYAWCRACDDIADNQDHGGALGDQDALTDRIEAIRVLTHRALAGHVTENPAFDALGLLASETPITPVMADDVIAGFALDAQGWHPQSERDMLRYCYHVAGAVGVMMAAVMGVPASDDDTLDRACDLGIAFQLGNIARDVAEDAAAGRCYLPQDWLDEAAIAPGGHMTPKHRAALAAMAQRLSALSRVYEASARTGAARLLFRQRWAVLSAAGIYGAIAGKVAAQGTAAWDRRVTTSTAAKLGFIALGLIRALLPAPAAASPALNRRALSADR